MTPVDINAFLIAEWRGTRHPYKVIAAEIAEWAFKQEPGTMLPGNEAFAGDLDIVASASTWKRARVFLRTTGILRGEGPFEVAVQAAASRTETGQPARLTWDPATPENSPIRGEQRHGTAHPMG